MVATSQFRGYEIQCIDGVVWMMKLEDVKNLLLGAHIAITEAVKVLEPECGVNSTPDVGGGK